MALVEELVMTIRAWLREDAAAGHRPREARLHVSLEAMGTSAAGHAAPVSIHNISATGMLLECSNPIDIDEAISIDLPRAPGTRAVVVWSSGQFHGCRFAAPLAKATLSAAQLQSAVDAGSIAPVAEPAAPGEPLEARLQRLRKQRGLTLAELALKLGVSKPTVWAWEQGRSAPSPDRHEKIAEVLGTTVSALRTGRQEDHAAAVLDRSRRRIAQAYGVSAESVRIMIEL
jgi:transcriptional regulator with XRE-family HTH domain